ncbi:hypothetical protein F8M41_023756 [Gigaspora margarita]|uniref:Uncharacterized protein n=1 Tax=Gigaspora margarita TaxID=4874 RepID=A0A8H4EGC9_GIGMA|nr:hypothetical protein F8M41_023756 [Gigaspora margarita]
MHGKRMYDVLTRQNTYPFVQENYAQPTRQNTYPLGQENYEIIKYQSALGNATNFHISDNDPNNVSQLARDIEDLKHLLENFCSFKRSDINYTDFEELLSKYSCSSARKNLSKNKNLVKISCMYVIELVIESTNNYLKNEGEIEQFLETSQGEKELSLETILVELEFMECPVDEDKLDKIMVDICYFPLIGINLENYEEYQVITRASIVQTDVNSNN